MSDRPVQPGSVSSCLARDHSKCQWHVRSSSGSSARDSWPGLIAVSWSRTAPISATIFRPLDRASGPDEVDQWARDLARTDVAQPAICLASLLYARFLAELGVCPAVVAGHSLGELTAFHLAGLYDEETLIALAAARGRAMASPPTCPAQWPAWPAPAEAEVIIGRLGDDVTVANLNSPRQT